MDAPSTMFVGSMFLIQEEILSRVEDQAKKIIVLRVEALRGRYFEREPSKSKKRGRGRKARESDW